MPTDTLPRTATAEPERKPLVIVEFTLEDDGVRAFAMASGGDVLMTVRGEGKTATAFLMDGVRTLVPEPSVE